MEKLMSTYQKRIATVALCAAMFIAFTSTAQETAVADPGAQFKTQARDWTLRFGLVAVGNSGDTTVTTDPGGVAVDIDGGGGLFVSFERRMTPLLGLEMGLLGTGSDMNISANAGGKHHWDNKNDALAMGSLTIGLNFHIVDSESVDFYAGPLLAFNHYAGVSAHCSDDCWDKHHDGTTGTTLSDSEVTWGAKAGVDFLLGQQRRWSVGGSVTYMDATYNFEQKTEPGKTAIDLDPVMLSVGVGFRF
jgi:outer membrane protein W